MTKINFTKLAILVILWLTVRARARLIVTLAIDEVPDNGTGSGD